MSAIAGLLHLNQEPIPPEQIHNLMKCFLQFPADDIRTWENESIFLGCHTQWITPESVGEVLPFYDYERQLAITADAIIDNRDELFQKLQVERKLRKAISDSKLILLAYAKWGEESPKHLIGDFAFMIWDEKERKLFGARDFSGARTLYYHSNNEKFAFSTTLQPFFQLPYVPKVLNENWIAEFLAIPAMFEAVDMTSTVYQTINQVPPAHSIKVVHGKVTLSQYCQVTASSKIRLKTNAEYEEAFQEVFERAVEDRIRTYGKVGSHLSGGLDSGTVVSFTAKALREKNKCLHTYSYIPVKDFVDWTPDQFITDESPYIKETVNHVGNIKDQYLSFEGKSPLDEVDHFLDMMEMPYKFFENSFWINGIYEKAHNDGLKIILNGARGNHSISHGSWTLTYNYYAELLKKLKWIRLYNELDIYCKSYRTGKKVMLPFVSKRVLASLRWNTNVKGDYHFTSFINPDLARRTNVIDKLKAYGVDVTGRGGEDPSDFRRKHFKQLYSWNKSGTAGTKLSLRYSLWERDPTNDLRVIRFCLSIPEEQFACSGLERSLIRRATKNLLPDKVRLNQRSRGIQGADVIHRMSSNWSSFISDLEQLPSNVILADLLNMEVIKNAISNFKNGPRQELLFDDDFKILSRSLILSRFLKKFS
ncbi:asparagine synthase (glutamine-hydrolyzing) [Evansella vedderi]|uniref:asparagine synthase (glutamine-hydrolyzing) n=1 Tax=Evansella vedderi TaxID=38282 RepID=A0ABT9ZZC8_9BACI|nr:asparagine synthase-related protein [Evansella vedderi]MDQ0256588.1 asparagine synthase (glutamine-hydrolyzing) [Evansella vedderi]